MRFSVAWAASLLALASSASASPAAAQLRTRQASAVPVIRGVNLGGWLISEAWWVLFTPLWTGCSLAARESS